MPFGCGGPSKGAFKTGWSYDETSKTLRVRVTPLDWSDDGRIASVLPEEGAVVVEGYWLPRPWTSSESCPSPSADARPENADRSKDDSSADPADEASTVGLAQFLDEDSNRSRQRRGRPLEVVANVELEDVPLAGLQLGFQGRIGKVPGGRSSTVCYAQNVNTRPSCMIAVELERISVLNPATGKEVANWRF